MTRFLELTVFLCATSVLTSNVTETQKTHEQPPSGLNALFGPANESAPASSATRPTVKVGREGVSGGDSLQLNIAEGGPIELSLSSVSPSKHASSKDASSVTEGLSGTPQAPNPEPENKAAIERSGKSTVVARKGVDNNAEPRRPDEMRTESIARTLGKNEPVTSSPVGASPSAPFVTGEPTVQTKVNEFDSDSEVHTGNGTASTVSPRPAKVTLKSTARTVMANKPKPKPTATIGDRSGDDVNKPIPSFPTKAPLIGMPRKMDYIVPIAITLAAVPVLGVAALLMYRSGKDCWDKRHYRRMDFLVDGMYND